MVASRATARVPTLPNSTPAPTMNEIPATPVVVIVRSGVGSMLGGDPCGRPGILLCQRTQLYSIQKIENDPVELLRLFHAGQVGRAGDGVLARVGNLACQLGGELQLFGQVEIADDNEGGGAHLR